MWIFILLFSIVIYLFYLIINQPPSEGFPEGPVGLPLVGNLFDLWNEEPVKFYAKQAEKYGSIYSIQLGQRRVVVLHSSYWIKKCLLVKGVAFSCRPKGIILYHIMGGKGIVMSDDDLNIHARRLLLKSFRNFGSGKNDVERLIDRELQSFMKNIKKKHEMQEYDPHFDLSVSILNITWEMLSGETFHLEDRTMRWIAKTIGVSLELAKFGGFASYTYFFQFIDTFCKPKSIFVGGSMFLRFLMFEKSIKNHRKSINEKSRSEDFIFRFLEEQEHYKDDPKMKENFSDSQLKWILSDIFIAALETTVTAIRWALNMASEYPSIQEELFKEIDTVIGRVKIPNLSDRGKMPYMEAFISEVLRRWPPIPLIMHAASKDITIDQYSIPKGTWVVGNLWGIHMDKKVWGDPEKFRPSRFLDDDRNYRRSENLLPFAVGRRNCIGEPLAMAEIFLFLTNIFQKYKIQKFDKISQEKMIGNFSIVNSPDRSLFKFVPRL